MSHRKTSLSQQKMAKRRARGRRQRQLHTEMLEDRRMLGGYYIPGTDPECGCNPPAGSGGSTYGGGSGPGPLGYNSSTLSSGSNAETYGPTGEIVTDRIENLPTSPNGHVLKYRLQTAQEPGTAPTEFLASDWTYLDATKIGFDGVVVSDILLAEGLASGSYQYYFEYQLLDSSGTDLGFQRFEPQQFTVENRSSSPFGKGWWLDGFEFLVESDELVAWSQTNDGSTAFVENHNGLYHETYGTSAHLRELSGNRFQITHDYGTKKLFDPVLTTSGTLASGGRYLISEVIDLNENTIATYGYGDQDGDLLQDDPISVVDEFGRLTQFEYYTDPLEDHRYGKLHKRIDSFGRETEFDYDTSGFVANIKLPTVKDHTNNFIRPQTSFVYTDGLLEEITNANGDTSYRSYGYAGRLESMTDFEGHEVIYSPQLVKSLVDPDTTSFASPADPVGTDESYATVTNERGYETIMTLGRFGTSTKTTDPLGNEFISQRNAQGMVERFEQTIQAESGPEVSVTAYSFLDAFVPYQIKSFSNSGGPIDSETLVHDGPGDQLSLRLDELGRSNTEPLLEPMSKLTLS